MSAVRLSMACVWLASLALAACNTPSVPIPPPQEENIVFEYDEPSETARFRYDPDEIYADAVVYVFNRSAGTGVISVANADGSVDPTEPFPAAEGDEVVVSFETEEDLVSTCVRFTPGRSDSGRRCDF